jgi:photosynthetic reaction center cytochrome c subunit
MDQTVRKGWVAPVVGILGIIIGGIATISAQQTTQVPQGPLAPEKYKNIQVLKDLPADQMEISMRFISAAVGLQCLSCHVQDAATGVWAYEKDDKGAHKTALQHMKIVNAVNSQFFNNRPTITCASCHAGRRSPNSRPPLAELLTAEQIAAMNQPRPQPPAPGQPPTAQPPAVVLDQVLDKYVEALGGRETLEKLQSRVISGTISDRAGQSFAFTIEEKVPNLYRESRQTKPSPTVRGFDGTLGWLQTGTSNIDIAGFLLQQALRTADLSLPLHLKEKYQGLAARAQTARLNGKEAYVLTGRPSPEVSETLYFETATGLLLRRTVSTRTPIGQLPEQIDYADYRVVGGVKMPFEIKRTSWDFVDTFKVGEIKPNATIEDARFTKPKG